MLVSPHLLTMVKPCDVSPQVSCVVDEGGGMGYVKARHYSSTLKILRAIDVEVIETQGECCMEVGSGEGYRNPSRGTCSC